jgi:hypothetical protein
VAPHFLALHEEGIPVIYARVDSQQPTFWFGRRLRHPSKSVARTIHGKDCKTSNFVAGILVGKVKLVKKRLEAH